MDHENGHAPRYGRRSLIRNGGRSLTRHGGRLPSRNSERSPPRHTKGSSPIILISQFEDVGREIISDYGKYPPLELIKRSRRRDVRGSRISGLRPSSSSFSWPSRPAEPAEMEGQGRFRKAGGSGTRIIIRGLGLPSITPPGLSSPWRRSRSSSSSTGSAVPHASGRRPGLTRPWLIWGMRSPMWTSWPMTSTRGRGPAL